MGTESVDPSKGEKYINNQHLCVCVCVCLRVCVCVCGSLKRHSIYPVHLHTSTCPIHYRFFTITLLEEWLYQPASIKLSFTDLLEGNSPGESSL